jgi:hypothetical protein
MNDLLKPIPGAREYNDEKVVGPFAILSGRPTVRVPGYEQNLKAWPLATADGKETEIVVWKESVPAGKSPYIGIMPKTSVIQVDNPMAAIRLPTDNGVLYAVRSVFSGKWYNPVLDEWTTVDDLETITTGPAFEASYRGNQQALADHNKTHPDAVLPIWFSYVISASFVYLPEVHLTYDEAWEVIRNGKV